MDVVEKGHVSVRRGVSWSPGGVRKPLQATQDMDAPSLECNASWDNKELKGQPTDLSSTSRVGHKTSLTRSASLSEKELKEARVRSQIIAAQLTIPSNSNSRGVQLFNRRKQRVNAFTLESCREGSGKDKAEHVKASPSSNKLTWAEKSSEDKDRELNCKNIATKALWSPTGRTQGVVSDIMEEPAEHFHTVDDLDDQVIQERHFQPVSEKEELEEEDEEEMKARKEEERQEALRDLEDTVRDEISPESANSVPAGLEEVHTQPVSNGTLLNGCYRSIGPEKVSVSISKPATAIANRTARPFLAPAAVQSPEFFSPVMDVPPVANYPTPPLPTFTAPRPVAFSPPPPPPSYPTPPLPAFTNQPPQAYSSPPPLSPIMSPASPPLLPQFPSAVSHMSHQSPPNPPAPHYGPPTAPRPSKFVPRPVGEDKPAMPIKTGILEEGAARRSNRKAMFTFKEKVVVSPNPELLSLVQGADERKKHGNRSVPEPVSEEELLALGAEASNFLAEEEKTEQVTSPEWASCLKTSRTRVRVEHKPEQSLTNASGKGAELFAKRQSRMEQFEIHKAEKHMRSPSPTMSLPPSWVFPSNMPGRVKAIAKNSDVCAQISQNLKAQQAVQRKPVKKAPPAPPTLPEPPPLENGCTKVEMDLSRHQPYQLNSSLFILNPIKEPVNSLPRGAPPPKPLVSSQSYSRQTSLPNSPPGQFSSFASYRPAQCMSPQSPPSPIARMDSPTSYRSASAMEQHRITSPVSAFSPERVASPRSGVQAPRPTFSAKRAGIEPQMKKELSPTAATHQTPTPTRTPSLTRRFSTPEGSTPGTWSPSLQTNQPPSKPSVTSPVSTPWSSRCQSPMVNQTTQPSTVSSKTFTTASPVSPPWGSRCQSPMLCQTNQPFSPTRPLYTSTAASPVSPARESRCMSPIVSNLNSKANHRLLAKNIINAAKRKNSPSPGALSGHSLPISPLGSSHHGYDYNKPSISPFQSRALGAQSPTFTSPPPTPTQRICSPVRLYNTRSLTDSDASVESEDSGLRSPGLRTYNTCPRGWGGSLRVKRSSVSTDL